MKATFDIDDLLELTQDTASIIALLEEPIVLDYIAREYCNLYEECKNVEYSKTVLYVIDNVLTEAVTLDYLAQKVKDGVLPKWLKVKIMLHENTSEITKKLLED